MSEMGDNCCEAFVKPKVIPPSHCHHVAKPLMAYLMHYHDHAKTAKFFDERVSETRSSKTPGFLTLGQPPHTSVFSGSKSNIHFTILTRK